jgi:hypothetical protein
MIGIAVAYLALTGGFLWLLLQARGRPMGGRHLPPGTTELALRRFKAFMPIAVVVFLANGTAAVLWLLRGLGVVH